MPGIMPKSEYYFDYLKKTDRFPQSVYHRAKHRMVAEAFGRLKPGSLVLDACCGIGHITAKYCQDYSIVGVDEQFSAIEYCRGHHKGEYMRADVCDLEFEENTFDLALFLDAIEHLQEPQRALKELARVLKPGSPVLICTMNYKTPLWIVLENTWHRFFGGPCKPYSRNVHPTQYTPELLREHCGAFFEEIYLKKKVLGMELFFFGKKGFGGAI